MKQRKSSGIKLSPKRFFGRTVLEGQRVSLPYQSGPIDATVVWSKMGYYKPGIGEHTGLCCADDGRYFVAREVHASDTWLCADEQPAFVLPGKGYWLRIHRLNLAGALLFALQNAAPELRAALLKALRRAPDDGCTVRFTSPDGSDPWGVDLSAKEAEMIQAHADTFKMTFGEALKVLIRRQLDECTLEVPGETVDVRVVVLRGTYEAGYRYCAHHGHTVEEAIVQLLEGFAEDAPTAAGLLAIAADRPDAALCAAAAPSADGDEDDAPARETPLRAARHWRERAGEARSTAHDLKPSAASSKLSGEADTLEQYADALKRGGGDEAK